MRSYPPRNSQWRARHGITASTHKDRHTHMPQDRGHGPCCRRPTGDCLPVTAQPHMHTCMRHNSHHSLRHRLSEPFDTPELPCTLYVHGHACRTACAMAICCSHQLVHCRYRRFSSWQVQLSSTAAMVGAQMALWRDRCSPACTRVNVSGGKPPNKQR